LSKILFEHISKHYPGVEAPAVDDITLEISAGSFVVLLGPSGCGKTTLLKMVNRLHEPTNGSIFLDGIDIRTMAVTSLRRQIGYVIQQVGLFPHMTVAQNIAVVPELVRWPRERIDRRIDELLELVQLSTDFRKRYPAQLSGGQQQRIGLARALAADPQVMLMDEPFGAIDAITRLSLQEQLIALQTRLKKTILFVTHDVDEALKLADEIVILSKGRLIQHASPCDLLNHPADDFVRQLLNSDDRIRQFSLLRVESVMSDLLNGQRLGNQPKLEVGSNLRLALSALLQPGVRAITVVDGEREIGEITMETLRQVGCEDQVE
jgi:osmoprotectant transport system ATP-binding protein